MSSFGLAASLQGTSVAAIVEALTGELHRRDWPAGTRVASIRAMAIRHGLSRYAVVEAYERLVATGYLQAKPGSGFFIKTLKRSSTGNARHAQSRDFDVARLIRRVLEDDTDALKVGGPWLPDDWLDPRRLRTVIRSLASKPGSHFLHYGHPLGYLPLRELIRRMVEEVGLIVPVEQIVLCAGTSQALDLVVRRLLRSGDTVMVDDPGYYNLFAYLRWYGARLVAVPRTPVGPDIAALRRCALEYRPKVYFTQTAMQNPTGSSMSLTTMHRVLAAATEFDFQIVEDDTYADLEPEPGPRLATLDGFERVIYVRSFSKTLSGSFRVGYVIGAAALVESIVDAKVLTSITTSPFSEMVVSRVLLDGHYRTFLGRLRARIAQAREAALMLLDENGLEIFCRPAAGNFLLARIPGVDDASTLQVEAEKDHVILAPGAVFRPNLEVSPWMRFNVALCDDPRLKTLLRRIAGRKPPVHR